MYCGQSYHYLAQIVVGNCQKRQILKWLSFKGHIQSKGRSKSIALTIYLFDRAFTQSRASGWINRGVRVSPVLIYCGVPAFVRSMASSAPLESWKLLTDSSSSYARGHWTYFFRNVVS
jgi:hypothetical protein